MEGKKIRFHLPVEKTRMKAEGNGTLHANETEEEDKMEVSISVWQFPEAGVGEVKIKHFSLTQKEVDLLRPSSRPEFEIECIDPSLLTP
jgi:hypothetical protein